MDTQFIDELLGVMRHHLKEDFDFRPDPVKVEPTKDRHSDNGKDELKLRRYELFLKDGKTRFVDAEYVSVEHMFDEIAGESHSSVLFYRDGDIVASVNPDTEFVAVEKKEAEEEE